MPVFKFSQKVGAHLRDLKPCVRGLLEKRLHHFRHHRKKRVIHRSDPEGLRKFHGIKHGGVRKRPGPFHDVAHQGIELQSALCGDRIRHRAQKEFVVKNLPEFFHRAQGA